MEPYKIEKGIKVPKAAKTGTDKNLSRVGVTLPLLKKGASFLVKEPLEAMRAEKKMRDKNAREREVGSGKVFTSRRVNGGVRIWRLK